MLRNGCCSTNLKWELGMTCQHPLRKGEGGAMQVWCWDEGFLVRPQ